MTIVSFFMGLKEVIVTIAAVIGACVAVKGLSTWRRQINGQSDHNLSKSLLISAFKYRDAISVLRHPFMPSYEMTMPDIGKADSMSTDDLLYYGRVEAYQARWKRVRECHAEIYANLIESEALWGKDLSDIWGKIWSMENELFVALDDLLRSEDPKRKTAYHKNSYNQNNSLPSELIFSKGENDVFKITLDNHIAIFEEKVRKKMKA